MVLLFHSIVLYVQTELPEFVTLTGTYDLDKSIRLSLNTSIIHLTMSKLLL
jgi:hypothetical protein